MKRQPSEILVIAYEICQRVEPNCCEQAFALNDLLNVSLQDSFGSKLTDQVNELVSHLRAEGAILSQFLITSLYALQRH
jgi:hypothetical protein